MNQIKVNKTEMIHTIGELGPLKDDTLYYFSTNGARPASTVFNEHGHLVCFYAKQMAKNRSKDTTMTSDSKQYEYFFSPAYFGESPVACIVLPADDKAGRKTITIYTFKRKYDEQLEADTKGRFGERLYAHGVLSYDEKTNSLEYYHCPQRQKDLSTFDSVPFLVGSAHIIEEECSFHIPRWLQFLHMGMLHDTTDTPHYLTTNDDDVEDDLVNVEFHKPGMPAGSHISVNANSKTMKVVDGSDVIEAICLWISSSALLA